ncbi:unnamed protein product [Ilex paraguariensis]|uniref:Uncharacterized protein n=1 Tax=Ilex paraguariensis TaxID=185542 RepID=A0ABC8V117_9AQUA
MLKATELGYSELSRFHHITTDGWKVLENDRQTLEMINYVDSDRVIDVYVEHINPNVFIHNQVDSNAGGLVENQKKNQNFESSNESGSYSDGESLEYEYFYDSEYDMHDDELYDTFVDHDVEFVGVNKGKRMEEDKGVAKGKRMEKGKGVAKGEEAGDRGTIMQDVNDFYGEEYDTNELVSLSGSSLKEVAYKI